MKRRTFLTAAAAVAASPLLVRRAFAQAPSERLTALFEAYRRARRHARPLLVILVPSEPSQYGWVGGAWGEYLNHGTEPQLAPLALFEPACATADDLAKLAPQAEVGPTTRFVVLGTDAVPATAKAYGVPLPKRPGGYYGQDGYEALAEAAIDGRITALAGLVAEAARDRKDTFVMPKELMTELTGIVAESMRDGQDSLTTPKRTMFEPEDVNVERYPGWAWSRAARYDPAGRVTERLADVARARFRDEPIPGSRWARSTGCGLRVEGATDNVAIGCGMGHTPRRSARFLYFYEKKTRE